jgi:hypothetical protein
MRAGNAFGQYKRPMSPHYGPHKPHCFIDYGPHKGRLMGRLEAAYAMIKIISLWFMGRELGREHRFNLKE